MYLKRELGKKGQLVIPKDIREHLGMRAGSKILFEVRGGEVILRPEKDPEGFVENFCKTSKKLKRPVNIKRVIEEEYEVS